MAGRCRKVFGAGKGRFQVFYAVVPPMFFQFDVFTCTLTGHIHDDTLPSRCLLSATERR